MIYAPRRLVLVGSVIADVMLRVPHLPRRGGDVMASAQLAQAGGGFNIMMSAHRLGLPAALAGRLGTGPIASLIRARFEREELEILVPPVEGDQGFTTGMIEPDGERTFVTCPGVESGLTRAELDAVEIRPDDVVVLSGYDLLYPVSGPDIVAWVQAQSPELMVVFDPGPLVADIPDTLLDVIISRADVIGLTGTEASLIAGVPDGPLNSQVRDQVFDALGCRSVILMRDGEAGVRLVRYQQETVRFPALPVEVVDTTGAGDTHTGAFLAELARGLDIEAAARSATIAASLSVQHAVSASAPTREESDAALARLGF